MSLSCQCNSLSLPLSLSALTSRSASSYKILSPMAYAVHLSHTFSLLSFIEKNSSKFSKWEWEKKHVKIAEAGKRNCIGPISSAPIFRRFSMLVLVIIFWPYCHSVFKLLPIPEKFSNHLKKKLPENVILKGPSGGTWQVELTTDDDTMFFKNGWEEFVKDHFLEEKDLLIFKYNRESCFEVLIFDGQSLCEKAASYFVRKCGHRERAVLSMQIAKRKTVEDSAEVTIACPQDSLGGTAEKSANDYIYRTPVENTVISEAINKKTRREIKFSKPTQTRQSVRYEEPSSTDEETEIKPDVEHIPINAPYVSRRRMVTEEDKLNALRLAQAAQSNEGFVVVMKPTHVYRKFYMVIPSGWANRHFRTLEKKDVILRMKENTWNTKFLYCKSKNSGGLSSGWRNFALDNKLQEFDVCLFEPSSAVNNSIVFDVSIFRVL